MIDEKDLPLLLFLEQKLIDSKNYSAFSFSSTMHSEIKSQSDFNRLARILIIYDIAKPIKGNLNPDIIVIGKTELTGERIIQDIFNEEQNSLKSKSVEAENVLLTNESLKYQQTIRDQEQQIRNLTAENFKVQKREKWVKLIYFLIGSGLTALGTFLTYKQVYGTTQAQKQPQQVSIESERTKSQKSSIQNQTITILKNDSTTNK